MKIPDQFILNLQQYYNGLNLGLLALDRNLDILFANDWVKDRLPLKETSSLHPLFGEHDIAGIRSLVRNTITYGSSQIVSKAFHAWLIPMPDYRFSDGLMRQTCMISPITCVETSETFALVQIKDESDGVLKTYKLQQIMDSLEKQKLELTVTNSELQQHREHLLQNNKMEAIGLLAGGIAHDFNNILFPISGLTEMLLWDALPDSPTHNSLIKITQATTRAVDLVKQILTFSQLTEYQKMPVRIQPILKETVKLARVTIPSNIEITTCIQADCGKVLADPTQLHQIVMNLVTNAYHAVESGGGIHVELMEALLEENRTIGGPSLPHGRYALIRISDTGQGIDPAIMDKIFNPYFTTKPQGKGTGLGLAVVHGIVKASGGDIRVDSLPGEGATFYVYLPMLKEDRTIEAKTDTGPPPRGSERILLIDDELPIVSMEKKILQHLGYQVTGMTDSLAALANFQADPNQYDLIITDMAMPNLTGEALSIKILKIRPDIPIILCTGFSETIEKVHAKSIGIKEFAMKPISTYELGVLIRQTIDDSKGPAAPDERAASWQSGEFNDAVTPLTKEKTI